jgi:hypothetical protein
MMKTLLLTRLSIALLGVTLLSYVPATQAPAAAKWVPLLDEELSRWDIFMGVPHHSVSLEGYEKGDGKNGTPIGLNQDPLRVFTVDMVSGEPVLHVSGEIYGGLSTKEVYDNYHLSLQVKFGEKKYEPRLKDKRDSGLLYHCQAPHGQFWNVWMRSQELQIQETDCGDYYALAGVSMDIRASEQEEEGKTFWFYDPKGDVRTFKSRCRRAANHENPHGEWTTIELICLGDSAYHIVNGQVVMVLEHSKQYLDEAGVTLTQGKLQLQSEAAEVYYKDIKIRPVSSLPRKIARQL